MRVETSAARHAREPGNTCWQCCSPPSPRLRRFLATRCATCRNQRHSDCYVDGRRVRFVDVTSYALKRGGAGKGRQGPRRRGSAPSSVCHFVWRGHYITTPVFEFSRNLIRNLARVLRYGLECQSGKSHRLPVVPRVLCQDCEEEDVRRK